MLETSGTFPLKIINYELFRNPPSQSSLGEVTFPRAFFLHGRTQNTVFCSMSGFIPPLQVLSTAWIDEKVNKRKKD